MKPNVILINCDDMGYGDLGCYGSRINSTPCLDRLAAEGLRFTDFYAASPVCSPSRGALMTGCYPARIGFEDFDDFPVLKPGMPMGLNPEETSIAALFKRSGYSTMIVGKWHCGDQPEFMPTRFGFDHFYGLPYSNDMGRQKRTWSTLEELDKVYPPLPLMEDETVIQQQPDQANLIERYVEHATSFIQKQQHNPFFLYFAPIQVHLPHYAPERFSRDSRNGKFGASMAAVDWAVSALMQKVEELGLLDNTMLIFTSDNGSRNDHGASNAPLRGTKGNTYEGGQRVPCIIYWKGHLIPRQVSQIASNLDFYATFAQMLGQETEKENDSVSFLPVLENREGPGRDTFFYFSRGTLEAVRKGEWKLHLFKKLPGTNKIMARQPVRELYDLETDPAETTNLYDENPRKVEELTALAQEEAEKLGSWFEGIRGRDCRPVGQVRNPKFLTAYKEGYPYIDALYDNEDDG